MGGGSRGWRGRRRRRRRRNGSRRMQITTIAPFLDYWRGFRERTRRVALVVPADQLEWSLAPGKWTFGDIVRHLAGIERDMYAENVHGRPSRYPGHGRELADGKGEIIAYLD